MAVVTAVLAGSCAKIQGPGDDGWTDLKGAQHVTFTAGSPLLRDDATKAGASLKTDFNQASDDVGAASADNFYVFGAKTLSGTRYAEFIGEKVTLKSLGVDNNNPLDDIWEYTPLRYWDPNASQYDFLAISGPSSAPSSNPANGNHVTANVTYDVTAGTPYDLLAAGYQRTNGSFDPVHFEFKHILSAVRVTIINDSPSINVTVNSYGFRNICYRATGTVEQSRNGLAAMGTSSWGTTSYTSSTILGHGTTPGTTVLADGGEFSMEAGKWDFMIPQDLAPYGDYTPQLMLDYEYDQENPYTLISEHNHPVFPIQLEQITVKNSDELISSWLPGKKYIYEIHIRLGGGVVVNVTVMDWEEVRAETPGLTIDDE